MKIINCKLTIQDSRTGIEPQNSIFFSFKSCVLFSPCRRLLVNYLIFELKTAKKSKPQEFYGKRYKTIGLFSENNALRSMQSNSNFDKISLFNI